MNLEEENLQLAELVVNKLNDIQIRELLIIQIATDLLEENKDDKKYQSLIKFIKKGILK